MPLIDQRILIAAPADAVWQYLSTPSLIPRWHKGLKQVSVLSTRTGMVGTRRRVTDAAGKAMIEEITHWLEHLGYEYVMVEGSFREYRARLRLQPIPEGTIVNWTLEYRLRGLFGGVRNTLGFRRRTETVMAESLRHLRRLVEASGVRVDPEKQVRFAMRAAPSVEDRAARAASSTAATGANNGPAAAHVALPPESKPEPETQPGAKQDSKPYIAQSEPAFVAQAAKPATPVPVSRLPEGEVPIARPVMPPTPISTPTPSTPAPSPVADTKPRKPKGLAEAVAAQQGLFGPESGLQPAAKPPAETPPSGLEDSQALRQKADAAALTVPVSLVAPKDDPAPLKPTPRPGPLRDPLAEGETRTTTFVPPQPSTLPEIVPTPREGIPLPGRFILPEPPPDEDADLPPPTNKGDTGEISIWDVFGVSAPSERTRTDLKVLIESLITPSGRFVRQIPAQKFARRRAVVRARSAGSSAGAALARKRRVKAFKARR